jgi:hypothetical protein
VRGVDRAVLYDKGDGCPWDAQGICIPMGGKDWGVGDRLPTTLLESGGGLGKESPE